VPLWPGTRQPPPGCWRRWPPTSTTSSATALQRIRARGPGRASLLTDADLELLAADRVAQVRAVAAQSPRLSADTVTRLSADRSGHVRYFILEAHPERIDLAEVMQHDKESDIADLAWGRLPARLRTRPRR